MSLVKKTTFVWLSFPKQSSTPCSHWNFSISVNKDVQSPEGGASWQIWEGLHCFLKKKNVCEWTSIFSCLSFILNQNKRCIRDWDLRKANSRKKKKVLNLCSVKIALCHLLCRMSCCKYSSRNINEDYSLTMHKGPKIHQ